MISLIYLDMDGVIADLDTYYSNKYGVVPREDPNKATNWPREIKEGMFKYLPTTQSYDVLCEHCLNSGVEVEILSCITEDPELAPIIAEDKKYWLSVHGLGNLKTNFTATKTDKGRYAHPKALLIDDSVACVNAFMENGGNVILHSNVHDTIIKLMTTYNI